MRQKVIWIFCIILILVTAEFNEDAREFLLSLLKLALPILGGIALILFGVGWVMPGIFIVLGKPRLAHRWLRGINPVAVSATPWEQLSSWKKLLTYIWSIVLSGSIIFAVIVVIKGITEK